MSRAGWLRHGSFLAAVLAFYGWLTLRGIGGQGLYFDVALLGSCALGLYKGLPWNPQFSLPFFGRNLILMVDYYHGAQESFLALPWIFAFGNTSLAMNLASAWIGCLCIPAVYWTAGLLFEDGAAACAACLLLVTSPAFIAACRLGLWTGMITCDMSIAALGCLIKWRRTGKDGWATLGVLLLGFGLGCRVQFLWFIVALALSGALLDRGALAGRPLKSWLSWGLASTAGLLPQIIINVRGRFLTIRYLAGYALISKSGVDNLAFGRNLGVRLGHFMRLAGGNAFFHAAHGDNEAALAFVAAALLWTVCASIDALLRGLPVPKRLVLPWLLIALILAQSTATPDFMDVHHLIMLLPLTCLAAAGAAVSALRNSRRGALRAAAAVLLAVSVVSQCRRLYLDEPWTNLHGGYEVRWNVVEELVEWARARHLSSLALGDTGIMDPMTYLSGGDLAVEEVFWAPYMTDTTRERCLERLRRRLRGEKEGYYVFRSEASTRVPFRADFLSEVGKAGKRAEVVETVFIPGGEPLFVVYRVS